ncbi:MAG: SprT-like domain-containing protein [archaeon]
MSLLVKEAYSELYNKECSYETILKYSRAFKGYNANVRFSDRELSFKFSYLWKDVSDDIKKGLVQSLMNKVFKTKTNTINIDMYNIFLKKVALVAPKTKTDPILEESYNRVNDKYFSGMVTMPNLIWGSKNYSKLGSYDYGTDAITISRVLFEQDNLLDYVMYHELLHKKLKFYAINGRSYHHTSEFRKKENEFEDPNIEEKLKSFLRRQRFKNILKLW